MNSDRQSLAVRKAELIARCAEQREDLLDEYVALKAPFGHGAVGTYLVTHKKWLLAAGGVALGVLVTRPKWVLGLAAAAASGLKVARSVMPMLARARGHEPD